MLCKRCGQHTPRLTLTQRYCPLCQREVASKATPPKPTWLPVWMRQGVAKDLTGGLS